MFKRENKTPGDYFEKATSWADDLTVGVILSRNRYRLALFSVLGVCALLSVAVITLASMQHVQLVVVHERGNGYSWVTTASIGHTFNPTWEQTKSELARYVELREGYYPSFYAKNGHVIDLQSAPVVFEQYLKNQSLSNPDSPVSKMGNKGVQKVSIQSILRLDSADRNKNGITHHTNQAQVTFTVFMEYNGQAQVHKHHYTTLISWKYSSPPTDPDDLLNNWDGFQVTAYQRTPVTWNTSR